MTFAQGLATHFSENTLGKGVLTCSTSDTLAFISPLSPPPPLIWHEAKAHKDLSCLSVYLSPFFRLYFLSRDFSETVRRQIERIKFCFRFKHTFSWEPENYPTEAKENHKLCNHCSQSQGLYEWRLSSRINSILCNLVLLIFILE